MSLALQKILFNLIEINQSLHFFNENTFYLLRQPFRAEGSLPPNATLQPYYCLFHATAVMCHL